MEKLMKKIILCFLGVMLIFTVLAQSIYDYLLPRVEVVGMSAGTIETKWVGEGKIGIHQEELTSRQEDLKVPISGRVTLCSTKLDGVVKKGETLFVIESVVSPEEELKRAIEEAGLEVEQHTLSRQKASLEEEIQRIQKQKQEKEDQFLELEKGYEVMSLDEEIANQQTLLDLNEALKEEGLIADEVYNQSKQKLRLLHIQRETTLLNKTKTIEQEIMDFSIKEADCKLQIAEVEDKLVLNKRKGEISSIQIGKVVAPISGVVKELNIKAGDIVEKNGKIGSVVPNDLPYRLTFLLPLSYGEELEVKSEVKWQTDQFKGVATVIKKQLTPEQENYQIIAELDQEVKDQIKLNLGDLKSVNVQIVNTLGKYECILPNEVIRKKGMETFIYILTEKESIRGTKYIAKKVRVTVLQEGDYFTALEAPIGRSDKVIGYTSKPIEEGQEVWLKSVLGE